MSTSLILQTFRHNGIAVFGTMPPMCRGCPDVNKLRGMDTTILGQHRPFMSIKSFVQHSGWQKMVSLCSLIRLIGVCADRDQPEFLCSRSDSRNLEVHVATAGGWLTRYRPREVRNSIYRYRKIHIDYRSKFLYRFISPISIIYGNTSFRVWGKLVFRTLELTDTPTNLANHVKVGHTLDLSHAMSNRADRESAPQSWQSSRTDCRLSRQFWEN